MFSTDQPIDSIERDLLDRKVFVNAVSDALLAFDSDHSLSVGLYGKWGHGKTSVINLIAQTFQKNTSIVKKYDDPIIFKFNPWNFSNQDQLLKQFFEQLTASIGKKEHGKDAEKVTKKLTFYSQLLLPLAMVPQLTAPALFLSKLLESIGKGTGIFSQNTSKDLSAAKQAISDALIKLKRKVVIIIDDIDRLTNIEICQVFQLVKSLGDFQNTIYILSLDKDIVCKALEKVQEGAGLEYLEKVIQVPFELPEVSQSTIHSILFNKLDEVLGNSFEDRWDKYYWNSVFHAGVNHFFHNLRDVNRYINVLQFELPVIQNEVNPIDFIAITALKVFAPGLYKDIQSHKDLFTGDFGYSHRYDNTDKQKKAIQEQCKEFIHRHNAPESTVELIKELFPRVKYAFNNTVIHPNKNWRRDARICSPYCFPTYFRLSVPNDEISREDMLFYLSRVSTTESMKNLLEELINDGKLYKFLDRFEDHIKDDIPLEHVQTILCTIMDMGDSFPEVKDNTFFSFGKGFRLYGITQSLLEKFPTQNERFDVCKSVIESCNNSIYTICNEIAIQGQQHGKNGSDHERPETEQTVTAEQLEVLEQMVLGKIKRWVLIYCLLDHNEVLFLLYCWRTWGDKKEPIEYVRSQIETDDGLIKLLENSLSEVKTSVPPYSYNKLQFESIKELVDIDNLCRRAINIKESPLYENLSSNAKTAITLLIQKINGQHNDFEFE